MAAVDPDLAGYVQAHLGACRLRLVSVGRGDECGRLLQELTRDLLAIRHPDEPEDPAASYVSAVEADDDSAEFWFDMHDLDELVPTVVALVEAHAARWVLPGSRLTWPTTEPRAGRRTATAKPVDPAGLPLMGYSNSAEGVSPKELCALIEGRDRSDPPNTACPVVLRAVDALAGDLRGMPDLLAELRPLVTRLPGARAGTDKRERAEELVDWALRDDLVAMLDATGHGEIAARFTDAGAYRRGAALEPFLGNLAEVVQRIHAVAAVSPDARGGVVDYGRSVGRDFEHAVGAIGSVLPDAGHRAAAALASAPPQRLAAAAMSPREYVL